MIQTPSKENVKFLGRAYEENGLVMLGFSGSGIGFKASKGEYNVTFLADSSALSEEGKNDRTRIGIFENGERLMDFMLDTPEKTMGFVADEASEINIVKLSECAMSTCAVKSISGPDSLCPAENKNMLIEFIGDSITCGFGVDDEDPEHPFTTATEDTTMAYAYRTAKKLGADWRMVSLSGYGIISGYSDDGEKKLENQLIPTYYEKCGYSYSKFEGRQPQDKAWNFDNQRRADFVVINLGTNDDSYCGEHLERQELFAAEYVRFLKVVRKNNPASKILCTLGMMGTRLCPFVEKAVKAYRAETGDNLVFYMGFDNQLEADGYVSCWHPTKVTHEKAAVKLAEKIKGLL